MKDFKYDSKTQTAWVPSDLDADSLVPASESSEWSAALQNGALSDGRALKSVNYVFSDPGAAEYNSSALSFLKIGTFTGSVDSPKPFGDGPSFSTKEDFGIS